MPPCYHSRGLPSAGGTFPPRPKGGASKFIPVKNAGGIFACFHFIAGFDFLESLSTFAGAIVFIGSLMALGNKKQALHDRIAGTAVFLKTEAYQHELQAKLWQRYFFGVFAVAGSFSTLYWQLSFAASGQVPSWSEVVNLFVITPYIVYMFARIALTGGLPPALTRYRRK
jgi:hypothetical protein